jgi:hypothetical protein
MATVTITLSSKLFELVQRVAGWKEADVDRLLEDLILGALLREFSSLALLTDDTKHAGIEALKVAFDALDDFSAVSER